MEITLYSNSCEIRLTYVGYALTRQYNSKIYSTRSNRSCHLIIRISELSPGVPVLDLYN